MAKRYNRKFTSRKNESVEDPHELLLSLVDLGSLDTEEALLACVGEMSDAECKRVLNSLSLPAQTEDVEDEVEDEETYIEEVPDEDEEDEEDTDVDEESEEESEPDEESEDEDIEAELEARIRRLEKCAKHEEDDDEDCEECNSRRRTESRKGYSRYNLRRRTESSKRRKLEGVDGFRPDIEEWFWENCNVDSYDDENEWLEEIRMTADKDNEDAVENCIEAMIDEYGYDEDGLERRASMIASILSGLARKAIRQYKSR